MPCVERVGLGDWLRCRHLCGCRLVEDRGDHGFAQPVGAGLLLGRLRFEFVAKGPQLVDLGDDGLLLG